MRRARQKGSISRIVWGAWVRAPVPVGAAGRAKAYGQLLRYPAVLFVPPISLDEAGLDRLPPTACHTLVSPLCTT